MNKVAGSEDLLLFNVDQIDKIPKSKAAFLSCDDSDDILSKLKILPKCIVVLNTTSPDAFSTSRQFLLNVLKIKYSIRL